MTTHNQVAAEIAAIPFRLDQVRDSVDALAYEQHTANLISVLATFDPEGKSLLSAEQKQAARQAVVERMGLPS